MWFDKSTQKKMVIAMAGFLALAFIGLVYFEWGKGGTQGGSFEVARINGRSIYIQEFRILYERIKESYSQDENNPAPKESDIMLQTLRSLIQKYIILQQAKKAGVSVSEEQIFRDVARRKEFQTDSGQFNEYLYHNIPTYLRKKIEQESKEGLVQQLFQLRILDSVKVSEFDLRLYFQQKYLKRKIQFVFIPLPEESNNIDNQLGLDENRVKIEKIVDNFIKLAISRGNFVAAANALGLKIQTTDYFTFFGTIQSPNDKNKRWKEIEIQNVYEQAFKLGLHQISDKISLPSGYAVIQVIGIESPDWKKFYYEIPTLTAELKQLYQNYTFNQWYVNVIKHSKIINNIDKLIGKDKKS